MREFDLKTVLSVTTGLLLTDMEELYSILNYMTDSSLSTFELPSAADEVTPNIVATYPFIGGAGIKESIRFLRDLLRMNKHLDSDGKQALINGYFEKSIHNKYPSSIAINRLGKAGVK